MPCRSGRGRSWADMDEEDSCSCCRRGWLKAIRREEAESEARAGVSTGGHDERPALSLERAHSSMMSVSAHWGNRARIDCAHSGNFSMDVDSDVCKESFGRGACTEHCTEHPGSCESYSPNSCGFDRGGMICGSVPWLSDGHLEGSRSVPCLHRRPNSIAMMFRENVRKTSTPRLAVAVGGALDMLTSSDGCLCVGTLCTCAGTRVRAKHMCRHRRVHGVRRHGSVSMSAQARF